MEGMDYKIVRTLRCKNASIPGTLGKLATAIGSVGVDVGNITTVHLGHHFTVRDVEVFLDNEEQLTYLLDEISRLKETTVLEVRDDVLELHKGGKIKMINTVSINSLEQLRKVYTPGVAEVCKLIRTRPSSKNIYTAIPYSVAIVTDGTRILGLGDVGPIAGMPVMESKAALLQQLVGISGIPILLNTTDPDRIVETIKNIAPTFGGIQLEDVASPKCFLIEDRLENELNIPVMHDDQQGTAMVVLATLVNACKLTNVTLQEAKIGLVGLGAAGLSIGKFLLKYTSNPTLGTARTKDSVKRHVEQGGIPASFDEIMQTADIVIATSTVGGLIKPSMIRKGQIIFALSNPHPEITAELAMASGAAFAVDGRTVNNLLAYPGIWRGTLDAMATKITYEMYIAAALAIAGAAAERELVPNILDPKVHLAVAHSVARAAVNSGVAQRLLDDDYFENTDVKEPPWI